MPSSTQCARARGAAASFWPRGGGAAWGRGWHGVLGVRVRHACVRARRVEGLQQRADGRVKPRKARAEETRQTGLRYAHTLESSAARTRAQHTHTHASGTTELPERAALGWACSTVRLRRRGVGIRKGAGTLAVVAV
eukprot:6177544-Pleurochrysis_carterae.AAC.5